MTDRLAAVRAAITKTPCWEWDGTKRKGYGMRKKYGKNLTVHRAIFEALVRKVPKGFVLDHLCRNRACANPFHLEIVATVENVRRGIGVAAINFQKTHCFRGHPLFGKNLYFCSTTNKGKGARICRKCRRGSDIKYRTKKSLNQKTI